MVPSKSSTETAPVAERYRQEREKRLGDVGNRNYIDISLSDSARVRRFQDDLWVEHDSVKELNVMFPTKKCRVLVLGAGLGGLQYAIHFLKVAGVNPDDLRIVDSAGGFGGAWYWNRYPGLSCDIESYLYLPRLEDTKYVPKQRYASGEEIREYANTMARHWNLTNSAVFQTTAQKLQWDASAKEWDVELLQQRSAGDGKPQMMRVRAGFVALVNGALNFPKLPDLPTLLNFRGKSFHTSRWDYTTTGGSPADPSLTRLRGQRVAVIGTGASGIQVVPHIAKWAEHLYVVQRTPASVDRLVQRKTDPELFHSQVASGPGWQRKRHQNMHQWMTTGPKPDVNLCKDHWTQATGMVAISGNPFGPKTLEEVPKYVQELHALDLPRQNRIRAEVANIVKNQDVASRLQAWYPTWCKRPCFSSDYEYLESFNRENVTLIDTDGKGNESFTSDSVILNGKTYPVDVIVFATGYRAPFVGSPAEKANATVIGRDGVSMGDEWAKNGASTLHGVLDPKFPNLFLSGPWQSTISPNNVFSTGILGYHAACILAESQKRAQGKPFAISSKSEAVQDWGMQILMRAAPMAAGAGCIPNYFNVEGAMDRAPPEQQMAMARSGLWGYGIEDYLTYVQRWREEGGIARDIDVQI